MSAMIPPAAEGVREVPVEVNSGKAPSSVRFLWVDAIRGLACMAVVLRHLGFPITSHPGLAMLFPKWLQDFHTVCAAGVYAFFVLSGFVIAHSLRSNALDFKSVGNFILRRQVRLDPVYWFALLLAVMVSGLTTHTWSFSVPNTIANMFYLQAILHKEPIIHPAWTLCIEIQFYLVFIAILFGSKFARRIRPENNATIASVGIVFVTGVMALALRLFKFSPAYFFSYWHYFALGVLSYYAVKNVVTLRVYAVFLAAFLVSLILSPSNKIGDFGEQHSLAMASMVVAFATANSLVYAARNGKMEVWGNTPVLQYLGKISYTLYLTHTLVIAMLSYLLPDLKDQKWSAVALYFLCIGVSIGVAHILHLLIERPSMQLASRLKSS